MTRTRGLWAALVLGAVAGAALVAALSGFPPGPTTEPPSAAHAAHAPPTLPVSAVPLDDAAWAQSDPARLRIIGLGTASGYAEAGGAADVCAQVVVAGEGAPAVNATIAFSASAGHLFPEEATVGPDGEACVTLHAPTEVGRVTLRAIASRDGVVDEATKVVEVVAAG